MRFFLPSLGLALCLMAGCSGSVPPDEDIQAGAEIFDGEALWQSVRRDFDLF